MSEPSVARGNSNVHSRTSYDDEGHVAVKRAAGGGRGLQVDMTAEVSSCCCVQGLLLAFTAQRLRNQSNIPNFVYMATSRGGDVPDGLHPISHVVYVT